MDSIFDKINMSKLRYVGSGSSNICLTDGVYAIKIGIVAKCEADEMNKAYQHGLGVPVLEFKEHVSMPDAILALLKKYPTFYCEGGKVAQCVFLDILESKYANVMIMPLIKPYMRHDYQYSRLYMARAYTISKRLAAVYNQVTGNFWEDFHPWNMGKYNGNLVILDF